MTSQSCGLRYDTNVWVYPEDQISRRSEKLSTTIHELEKYDEQTLNIHSILLPINRVRPGDWIYSFDGRFHKVELVKSFLSHCEVVGLQHSHSDKTLWLTNATPIPSRKQTGLPKSWNDWSAIPKHMTEIRKYLRNNPTRGEQRLWSVLSNKKLGYKFRRQHSIGPYIVDFYSRDGQIVIEVDGASHFSVIGMIHDLERDQYIESLGLKIIHVTNDEVMENLEGVVELIVQNCSDNVISRSRLLCQEAALVEAGDLVYFGQDLLPVRILKVDCANSNNDVFFELLMEDSGTYLSEICLVGRL